MITQIRDLHCLLCLVYTIDQYEGHHRYTITGHQKEIINNWKNQINRSYINMVGYKRTKIVQKTIQIQISNKKQY